MADAVRKGKDDKAEGRQKIVDVAMLLLILCSLEKFHVRIDRYTSFLGTVYEPGCFNVTSLYPDEDVRVKYH